MPVEIDRFIRLRPFLWHLTARDNLPAIRACRTLFSAERLNAGARVPIDLSEQRLALRRVDNDRLGPVLLRDQKPLRAAMLTLAPGYAFGDLLQTLNARVFFWPGDADQPIPTGRNHFKCYAGTDIVVLRIPAASLLKDHAVEVTRCNSGSSGRMKGQSIRGPETFQRLTHANFTPGKVIEVTVRDQITLPPDTEVGAAPGSRFDPL